MKKLLLLSALAVVSAPAYADGISDNFKLVYNGQEVFDGQTISVNTYYDPFVMENPEFEGMFDPSYQCNAIVEATNLTQTPKTLQFSLNPTEPVADEWKSKGLGMYQLCFSYQTIAGTCAESKDLKGFYSNPSFLKPVPAGEYMEMDIHQLNFEKLDPVTLKLDLRVVDNGTPIGNASLYINFTHEYDITMSVDGIVAADAPSAYYTLQGVRVAEPQKGQIYIERKGGKATKRIY